MNNFEQEKPISAIPHGNYAKWGYGTFPTSDRDWEGRIEAVKNLLAILDGDAQPLKNNKTLTSLSIVRTMFHHIHLRDSRDWFTMTRQLAFPSSAIARPISASIRALSNAIVNDDRSAIAAACNRLRELPVPDMLEHYLDITVRAQHPIVEKDFAFVLWSESRPWELWIGATTETIDEVVKTLKRDYPDRSPYGVVGAYLVNSGDDAGELLRKACVGLKPREPGFYKCSIEESREVVEAVLNKSQQIRLSPWHGDEPEIEKEPESKAFSM